MKTPIFLLCFLVLAFDVFAFSGRVVKVADGDTVTVLEAGNHQTKIRLYGIDAPEKRQAFGERSRQTLASLIAGQTVEVKKTGKDRYGRTVGIITLNGKNINREMIKSGMAWVYDSFCKRAECAQWRQDERYARDNRKGLWRDNSPIAPWEWRKKH